MNDSILQQSRQSKSWKRIVIIVFVFALLGILWFLMAREADGVEKKNMPPDLVEVTKGNLLVSVEGEGKIINPNIVNLSFLINGTLQDVNVEEGQMVQAGDVIATLDPREFNFDLRDAQNQVNIAWANIKAKEAELTDQSLRLAQNDLVNSEQVLRESVEDYEQALNQSYDSAELTIETALQSIEDVVTYLEILFSVNRQDSVYKTVARTFNDSVRQNQVKNLYYDLARVNKSLKSEYSTIISSNHEAIPPFIMKMNFLMRDVENILENVQILFNRATPYSGADSSLVQSAESDLQSLSSKINSQSSALNNAVQSIDDAKLNREQGEDQARRSLETTELKLENSERDYDRAKINKATSLTIQYAQLQQAQVRVEKARYNLSLATLRSPIDGEATVVNGKPGETIKADTANAENAFVRIISDDNFTTEVYIEEVDIARIRKGQTAIITLDAIPEVELEGTVTYVSNVSTIDNNGVTTYLVRVEIIDTKKAPIREGMTSYVEFVEHQALDALLLPSTAIVNEQYVFDQNGERVPVRTGITDGRMMEIYEGVIEGQKILSRPPGESRAGSANREGAGRRPSGDMNVDDRMKMIGDRLRENGMLPEGWEGMSAEQKQKALEKMREAQGGGGFGGGATRGGGGGGGRR